MPDGFHGTRQFGQSFSTEFQSRQKSREMNRIDCPCHDGVESSFCLLIAENLSRSSFVQKRCKLNSHRQAACEVTTGIPAIVRKLARSSRPATEAMLSGWNCTPCMG